MCLTCVISYKLPWHMEYSLFSGDSWPSCLLQERKDEMPSLANKLEKCQVSIKSG